MHQRVLRHAVSERGTLEADVLPYDGEVRACEVLGVHLFIRVSGFFFE